MLESSLNLLRFFLLTWLESEHPMKMQKKMAMMVPASQTFFLFPCFDFVPGKILPAHNQTMVNCWWKKRCPPPDWSWLDTGSHTCVHLVQAFSPSTAASPNHGCSISKSRKNIQMVPAFPAFFGAQTCATPFHWWRKLMVQNASDGTFETCPTGVFEDSPLAPIDPWFSDSTLKAHVWDLPIREGIFQFLVNNVEGRIPTHLGNLV